MSQNINFKQFNYKEYKKKIYGTKNDNEIYDFNNISIDNKSCSLESIIIKREEDYLKENCSICNKKIINKNFRNGPTRLLNIEKKKIVLTNNLCNECFKMSKVYWCISHTWENQDIKYKYNWIIQTALLKGINWIWVDIFCINQDDKNDKNNEIPKMYNYYTKSIGTLVLLNSFDKTIENIGKKLYKFYNDTNILSNFNKKINENLEYFFNILKKEEDFLKNIHRLINFTWFTRVWTLQEMCLPKKIILANNKCTMINITGSYYIRLFFSIIIKIQKKYDNLPIKINEIFEINAGIIMNSIKKVSFGRICYYSMNRSCKEIEDKAYGIMGLLNVTIDINYKKELDPLERLNSSMKSLFIASCKKGDISCLLGINNGCLPTKKEWKVSYIHKPYSKNKILCVDNYKFKIKCKIGEIKLITQFLNKDNIDEIINSNIEYCLIAFYNSIEKKEYNVMRKYILNYINISHTLALSILGQNKQDSKWFGFLYKNFNFQDTIKILYLSAYSDFGTIYMLCIDDDDKMLKKVGILFTKNNNLPLVNHIEETIIIKL